MSDMLKLAHNLNIELDVEHLMSVFNPDGSGKIVLTMPSTHALYVKLRTPINVGSHHNPHIQSFPPDRYVSNPSDDHRILHSTNRVCSNHPHDATYNIQWCDAIQLISHSLSIRCTPTHQASLAHASPQYSPELLPQHLDGYLAA